MRRSQQGGEAADQRRVLLGKQRAVGQAGRTRASPRRRVTGPEVLAGAVHGKAALGKAPTIPLIFRGLVNTSSSVTLGGGGPHPGNVKSFATPKGKFTVMVSGKPTHSQTFNPRTCRFSFTQDIPVTVLGSKSTGAFAGVSGPGAAQVNFAATGPRYLTGPKKGQCNPRGRPIARSAVATFLASAVLTTP